MKITSFEHGCEICGYDPEALPAVSHLPAIHQRATISGYKLFVISQASWKGEGKKQDWSNWGQHKWYPVFDLEAGENNPTGFRFFASYFVYVDSSAGGGSRICYPSREDSDYHGRRHIDLYRDLLVCEEVNEPSLNSAV